MSDSESPQADQLILSALKLPIIERINLASALLESVDETSDVLQQADIDASWNDEIRKRINEIDGGEVKPVSSAALWKQIGGKPDV